MAIQQNTDPNMTLEQFVRLFEQQPFELIDGERVFLMPPVARHNFIVRALFLILHPFVSGHKLGEVFTEAPFVLTYSSNWVKGANVPDVMFIEAGRLNDYKSRTPDWQDKPYMIVPDLVVEVISPNDVYTDVNKKVVTYLQDGVRLI